MCDDIQKVFEYLCEVEFFGRCVFEEGAVDLFSLIVVSTGFHALLPDS